MINRIKQIIKWGSTAVLALVLLGFANVDRNDARCWKFDVEVEHLSGLYFIDEAFVREQIHNMGQPVVGSLMDSLDITDMRSRIMQLPSVKEATVYKTVDGCVKVKVRQRSPLFRVITKNHGSYYVDNEGGRMPLSNQYTARVPVITGNIDVPFASAESTEREKELIQSCFDLIKYFEGNSFWSSQAEHFVVDANGDFVMIPRVGRAEIIIGDETELDSKLRRLKAFMKEMSHKNNLNKYKRINVKYRDQVVCERFY